MKVQMSLRYLCGNCEHSSLVFRGEVWAGDAN